MIDRNSLLFDEIKDLVSGPDRHILDHLKHFNLPAKTVFRGTQPGPIDFTHRDISFLDMSNADLSLADFTSADVFFFTNFQGAALNSSIRYAEYLSCSFASPVAEPSSLGSIIYERVMGVTGVDFYENSRKFALIFSPKDTSFQLLNVHTSKSIGIVLEGKNSISKIIDGRWRSFYRHLKTYYGIDITYDGTVVSSLEDPKHLSQKIMNNARKVGELFTEFLITSTLPSKDVQERGSDIHRFIEHVMVARR